MTPADAPAPEWRVSQWFNTATPLSLAVSRGRVVMAVAFQMLCPSCVAQALPQAQRAREAFREEDVAVVGLHTVFEHHEAMTPAALKAFLHEYRIGFPVGVDEPSSSGPIPATMETYQMRGTPTLLLYNRAGRLRRQAFGHVPDLALGAELMALVEERGTATSEFVGGENCSRDECS